MIKLLFFALLNILFVTLTVAQDTIPNHNPNPPIPVEVLAGNNRLAYQIVVNRKLFEKAKLGFFSVSTFAVDYKNDKTKNDYMTPVLINYEIIKGFCITSGVAVNSNWGFRPFAGTQYTFVNRNILAVAVPGFYLTESHNFETLALIEYQPRLKKNWILYSRLQGLYNINMKTNNHDRSYIYARLGVSYKTFGFGLGSNLDWYGSMKKFMENYGIFLRVSL